MRANSLAAIIGLIGATACASPNVIGPREATGVALMQPEGVRVGRARVVSEPVRPLVPVRVEIEDGAVAIRFAHPSAGGAVAHIDPDSLAETMPEEKAASEPPAAPSTRAVRAVFPGGRFIECYRSGSLENGYRLMAQEWTGDGSRIGGPVPISPPEADVVASPQLVSVNDHRAVAIYVASTGEHFELRAVSLDAQ